MSTNITLAAFPMLRTDGVIHASLSVRLLGRCLKREFSSIDPAPIVTIMDIIESYSADEAASIIVNTCPDIVGLSAYLWNYERVVSTAREIKRKNPDLLLILGGPNAGFEIEQVLKSGIIDFILLGEAEYSLAQLVGLIARGKPNYEYHNVAGLYFLEDGEVRQSTATPTIVDIARLPIVWTAEIENGLPNKSEYSTTSFAVELEVSRGCPNRCTYCTWGKNRALRRFPLIRVEQELRNILENEKVREVFISDFDCFTHEATAANILDTITKYNYRSIPVYVCIGPLSVRADMLKKSSRVPGLSISVGIQSTDKDILRKIGRAPMSENLLESIGKARRGSARLNLAYDVIFGMPNQSYADFEKTLNDVLGLFPSSMNIHVLQVLPGSKLWEDGQREGLEWESRPPYRVRYTNWMSVSDMARARKLAFWVLMVISDPFLRNAVFELGGAWKRSANSMHIKVVDSLMGGLAKTFESELNADYPDPNKTTWDDFIKLKRLLKIFKQPLIIEQGVKGVIELCQSQDSADHLHRLIQVGNEYMEIIKLCGSSIRFLDPSIWHRRLTQTNVGLDFMLISASWDYQGYWKDMRDTELIIFKKNENIIALPAKDCSYFMVPSTMNIERMQWNRFDGPIPTSLSGCFDVQATNAKVT